MSLLKAGHLLQLQHSYIKLYKSLGTQNTKLSDIPFDMRVFFLSLPPLLCGFRDRVQSTKKIFQMQMRK